MSFWHPGVYKFILRNHSEWFLAVASSVSCDMTVLTINVVGWSSHVILDEIMKCWGDPAAVHFHPCCGTGFHLCPPFYLIGFWLHCNGEGSSSFCLAVMGFLDAFQWHFGTVTASLGTQQVDLWETFFPWGFFASICWTWEFLCKYLLDLNDDSDVTRVLLD